MLLRIGEHPNIVGHQGFYVGSNQVSDLPLTVARTRCLNWLLAWVPTLSPTLTLTLTPNPNPNS